MTSTQVVVAHFHEDLGWLSAFSPETPICVYHKGGHFHIAGCDYCRLDNVGREAHTYLHHIHTFYDSLADITLFCQGQIQDHSPGPLDVGRLLELPEGADVGGLVWIGPLREWDDCGRLRHWGKWGQDCLEGRMRLAPQSFTAWWREFVSGQSLPPPQGLRYFLGSIFAVRAEVVRRRTQETYQVLLDQLSDHPNPEEAYFLERAWTSLWGIPPEKVVALSARGP